MGGVWRAAGVPDFADPAGLTCLGPRMNIKAPFAGSATKPALPTTPGRFDAGNRGQNGPAVPVLATAFARFNAPCSPFMPAFSPSATAPATAR